MDELKTKSPRLEKDFGKTRDGQKMVLSVTVALSECVVCVTDKLTDL